MSWLFSPLNVKGHTLSNRIVLPPMATNLAGPGGAVNRGHLEHYRARSGAGLVIVEHTYVQAQGRLRARQLGVDRDDLVSGWRQLVAELDDCGTLPALQLAHAGASAEGQPPVGPSAVAHPVNGQVPRELSRDSLVTLRRHYREAARRCQEAGFPAVEVHGAHGYLLNQFLSPLTNQRRDEYGGSLARRMRFPLEVVESARQELGDNVILLYRLGADDGREGGFTLEEARQVAPELVRAGVDILDVSGGMQGYLSHGKTPAFFAPLARGIKEVVPVPVICTGGIREPELAEQLLQEGVADLIGVGRAFLADPNWVEKARQSLEP